MKFPQPLPSKTTWLVPSYIKEVRVDFIKHIKNLRKYPKMTDKDWSNQ